MKPIGLFICCLAVCCISCGGGPDNRYPDRWVFVHGKNLASDRDLAQIAGIADTAARHGLTGITISAGFDRLDLHGEDYFAGLEKLKGIRERTGLEIIPVVFSAGYGGSILAHDPNLAAGLPVRDALFVAGKEKADFVSELERGLVNGGFEEITEGRVAGFESEGRVEQVFRPDTESFREGSQSLRFEDFGDHPEEAATLRQKVAVTPHRCYVISLWVRTEQLSPGRRFRLEIEGRDRRVGEYVPRWGATNEWTHLVLGFNSWDSDTLEVVLTASGAESGALWVDGLELVESGPANILRRPGCPLEVRGESSGTVYEEGRDYARLEDPRLDCRFEHEAPELMLLPNGRISEGERLRVSWYHGFMSVKGKGQKTICMSAPGVYDIWREQARLIHRHLAPERYFLDMDEIRAGGTCKACTDRNMSMGEILGSCVTRQFELIREANPEAEVYIWADMLDKNHNAGEDYHGRDYYYQAAGLYTGSWKHIPRELIMVCWWDRIMDKSLSFFSGLGHRTLAGSYYDADDLENPKAWLEALDKTPGARGIMYTTWENKYELLDEFAELVSRPRPVELEGL